MNHDEIIADFLQGRVIFMDGQFNEQNCQLLKKHLLFLFANSDKEPITIYIDSYGGDVCSYLEIYNLISTAKVPIHTVVTGKAMSAGAYLLLAGTKGCRFAYKHSQIMMHELSYGTYYQKLHDQKTELEYSEKLQNILNDITKKHTKIKNIPKFLKHDKFLSSEEALRLGIIDKIIGE